jgi:hypothetical protein
MSHMLTPLIIFTEVLVYRYFVAASLLRFTNFDSGLRKVRKPACCVETATSETPCCSAHAMLFLH